MLSPTAFDPSGSALLVAGLVTALASLVAAVWMVRLGDVVTAGALIVLVAAGLLLVGIDGSPDATAP
jgi:hypothetical protein